MAEPSVKDLAYRTAASIFGGPVDLATMVMRPFGYKTPDEKVFGSSEYIGKKLEDVGLVSSARAPITEFLTSMAVPTPAGIAKGTALAAPQVLSMFVGARSLTWDASAAEKAKIMADIGIDARTIWKETGTWKGPDGKWRQEIDDSGASFIDKGFKQLPLSNNLFSKGNRIDKVISHDPLYKAYPGARMLDPAIMIGNNLRPGGSFKGDTGVIEVTGQNKPQALGVGLHEIQHAIQKREGFARGGNTGEFARGPMFDPVARDLVSDLSQNLTGGQLSKPEEIFIAVKYGNPAELNKIANKFGFSNIDEALVFLRKEDEMRTPFGQYQRLAGEAEARATEARRDMTPEQRRAAFPEESYDVPINQLIVR